MQRTPRPDWRLPQYELTRQRSEKKDWLYDPIRRQWVADQPEEEVRQHLIRWLIEAREIVPALISVEKEIRYRGQRRRFDLVIFDRQGKPWMLCECKAPEVALSQQTVNQIARYNLELQAPHLLLTNGKGLAVFSLQPDGRFLLNREW